MGLTRENVLAVGIIYIFYPLRRSVGVTNKRPAVMLLFFCLVFFVLSDCVTSVSVFTGSSPCTSAWH